MNLKTGFYHNVGEQPEGGEHQLRGTQEEPPRVDRVQVYAEAGRNVPLRLKAQLF